MSPMKLPTECLFKVTLIKVTLTKVTLMLNKKSEIFNVVIQTEFDPSSKTEVSPKDNLSTPRDYFTNPEIFLHQPANVPTHYDYRSLMMGISFLLQGMIHSSTMFLLLMHKMTSFHLILPLIHVMIFLN